MPKDGGQPSPTSSPRKKGRRLAKTTSKPKGKAKSEQRGVNNNAVPTLPQDRGTRSRVDLKSSNISELAKNLEVVEKERRKEAAIARKLAMLENEKNDSLLDEESGSDMEIETEVTLHPKDDEFRTEESSSEEEGVETELQSTGQDLGVSQSSDDRDVTANPEDQISKEIQDNPGLWDMVQRMVNKAKAGESSKSRSTRTGAVSEKTAGNKGKPRNNKRAGSILTKSNSDTTIYTPALKRQRIQKSIGSPQVPIENQGAVIDKITNFVDRLRLEASLCDGEPDVTPRVEEAVNEESEVSNKGPEEARAQSREISDALILDAERNKAVIAVPKGKSNDIKTSVPPQPIVDVAQIDNQYFLSTCHVDETTREKIYNGKYVDLEKLLPNPKKFRTSEEGRAGFELIKKDGLKYLVQNEDGAKDNKITGVRKWAEAFRIYTALYSKANPLRSAELMQYMHTIHLASGSFQ